MTSGFFFSEIEFFLYLIQLIDILCIYTSNDTVYFKNKFNFLCWCLMFLGGDFGPCAFKDTSCFQQPFCGKVYSMFI